MHNHRENCYIEIHIILSKEFMYISCEQNFLCNSNDISLNTVHERMAKVEANGLFWHFEYVDYNLSVKWVISLGVCVFANPKVKRERLILIKAVLKL